MIWDSVALMTLIDLVIIAVAAASIRVVWSARAGLHETGVLRRAAAVIFGLTTIGLFYFADLWIMHVQPRFTSVASAMATMESIHLDWSWIVSLIAVLSIFVGFVGIVRSRAALSDKLRDTHDELRQTSEERATIEERLTSVEYQFEHALRAAEMGMWIYDPVTEEFEWSERAERLFGYEPGTMPTSLEAYQARIHPEDLPKVQEAGRKAMDSGGWYSTEHRTLMPNGELKWIAGQGWVSLDDGGRPKRMRGVVWDVTERRQAMEAKEEAERRQEDLNRRLSRQQRIQSLGTLSGGIAHDFNNLLTPIFGHVEILQSVVRNEADLERLQQIQIAAERARGLVRQILAFSGNVEPAGKAVDASEVVGQSLDLVRATLPSTIEIRRDLDPEAGAVSADATQLTQVIVNLCTNSAHAMPDGGVLAVSVSRVDIDAKAAEAYPELSPGPHVRIVVSDTGTGISEAVAERAFEPFFTTKEVGLGSGLGLSQVLGIVTTYGGAVMLYGKPDHGTTVHVFLPSAELEMEAEEAPSAPPVGGSGRVLLVDDEPAVANLTRSILESLGYVVTLESNPTAAWERFQRAPDRFDVLVTDHTMPGMTGAVLAARTRSLRPGLPTVLMSGYSDPEHDIERDIVFLMKPFNRAALAEAVRAAVDGSESEPDRA